MSARALFASFAALGTLALAPVAVAQESAASLLKRASDTMGNPKSIQYNASGTGWTFGQAFKPGAPWPKIDVKAQTRTIDYANGAMREEITLSRAEPKGGGGYPLQGDQRNDQYVSGDFAWNVAGGNPQPGPRFVVDRTHQLWTTPHGILQAAARNGATVRWETKNGKSLAAVSFTQPGRFSATAYINDAYLVERIESRLPDAVMGEVAAVTEYADYRDFKGVMFPTRIKQTQGGFPTLDVTVKDVMPNAAAAIAVPDAVAKATERVTTDKVAEGVWFVAGGSHNSVAIEMKDHMVLVEAPLGDYRVGPVIDAVKKLAPGKPIRFAVNSHHHFDHTGGIRRAAAEGATIVTHTGNKASFERNLATPSKILPDALTRSGRKAAVRGVGDKATFTDGTRVLEIYSIKGGNHAGDDNFMMVWLPKERLLIEADAFTPLPPNAKPPATPNANNVTLIENIERLKLPVDRFLPLHGRVVPLADLYTTAGRTPPK
jgi:glyoxylase-like metal-dependent hydrolase (beta-lactamase superfamily II)